MWIKDGSAKTKGYQQKNLKFCSSIVIMPIQYVYKLRARNNKLKNHLAGMATFKKIKNLNPFNIHPSYQHFLRNKITLYFFPEGTYPIRVPCRLGLFIQSLQLIRGRLSMIADTVSIGCSVGCRVA